jgi:glucosamine--fructose-6-phosphate aminotransferase (isomerizing)
MSSLEKNSAMNLQSSKYKNFALVHEMLETPDLVGAFDFDASRVAADVIRIVGRLFLTGEGSSRIFPAKNMIYEALKLGVPLTIATEGARQAHEYELGHYAVFGASNSGKTKELISLFTRLRKQGHMKLFGLTATSPSMLEDVADQCYTLRCGKEDAVAATKSVVEQALFYRSLLGKWEKSSPLAANQKLAAEKAKEVLEAELDPAIVDKLAKAPVLYFAGRNNGVAEELTLKTNEITHKKSDYLEGTYAVHGIEEIMRREEVVVVIDPFPAEIEKFQKTLVDGVGLTVIAVADRETSLPTIRIPKVEGYETVLQLLAGWNILVQVGVALGINLDKAERARKIGNEFIG